MASGEEPLIISTGYYQRFGGMVIYRSRPKNSEVDRLIMLNGTRTTCKDAFFNTVATEPLLTHMIVITHA